MLQSLGNGFKNIDGRVLGWYRSYAERWEARGHGRYGLPLLLYSSSPASLYPVDALDFALSSAGFLVNTPEPTDNFLKDVEEIRSKYKIKDISYPEACEQVFTRLIVAFTTPFRHFLKKSSTISGLGDIPLMIDGKPYDLLRDVPSAQFLFGFNRSIRLPLLVGGLALLVKSTYDVGHAFVTGDSRGYYDAQLEFPYALAMLQTASSMYWKDADDPNLQKKRRPLAELVGEAWESVKDRVSPPKLVPDTVGYGRNNFTNLPI